MSRITCDIGAIVNQLRCGNVVALPTETVYGLGADATNEFAVRKIFNIKNRPLNHPLIMHVAPEWDLTQWVEKPPAYVASLVKAFWPGPLTLVLKLKTHNLSQLVTGNQNTVAIRSPAHPLTLEILRQLGRPIVAPSANPFGKVSPTEAQHVLQDFTDDSFLILDGGVCHVGIESTILYCVYEDDSIILRHGIIGQSEIQPFCSVLNPDDNKSPVRVSGNLKSHYQPQKPLFYFNAEDVSSIKATLLKTHNSYILCFSRLFDNDVISYNFPSCPKKAAREFYRQLRMADQSSNSIILIELPPKTPQWHGLTDRIKKAGVCFTGAIAC